MDQATPQSAEERMMAFVEAEDAPREVEDERPSRFEETDVPKVEAEAKDEGAEPEVEEETTEEEQRTFKLKHNEVEIEKPESEVIALAQQGFDYTQKTQKLAEERKQVESFAQTLKSQEQNFQQQVQIQSALMGDIAKATSIDQQLSQYAQVNWQQLSDADPVEAQKLFFAYNQLQTQKGQVVAEIQKKQQEFTSQQQQHREKQLELARDVLAKDIPGWGPELAKNLVETGKSYGFDDNELSNLTDPRTVKVLHDAAQWRKFQATKSVVDKKVATASPQVKPGAKDTKNANQSNLKANRDALRRTGKSDYAARLIESMI